MTKRQGNVHDYAKRLIQNNNLYDLAMLHRREEAKAEAERLAAYLLSKIPEITRIWGFGSVFDRNRPFSHNSDIDIAIEGGDYFKAYKIVEKSSFKVDLIDITGRKDKFASLIREHGSRIIVKK